MKFKFVNLLFATAMIFSVAFIGELTSINSPFSAKAQTVKVKKKKVGAIRTIARGGKYVGKQVWNGTKWVSYKSYRAGRYGVVKTYQGGKYVGKKTVKGAKYAGKKTWKGTKWVGKKVY